MFDTRENSLYIKSLEKGLAVLQLFESALSPLTLTEISNQTGLGISATQRYVYTLEKLGFLERISGTRRYRPALNNARLGHIYKRLGILPQISFTILKNLSEKFGEISWLCTLSQFEIIKIISSVETMSNSVYPTPMRSNTSICTSAAGRAILSGYPAMEVVSRVFSCPFKTLTSKTLIDPRKIVVEIELARKNGFSLVEGDLTTFSVAAPIFNSKSQPIAAIEIQAPRTRWKWRKDRLKLARNAASAAETASISLKKIGAL